MRVLLALLLAFSSLVFATHAQTKRSTGSKPKVFTVKGPPADPAKPQTFSVGNTVEKYVSNYNLNADGTASEIREIQQRCSSELCIEHIQTFALVFNSDLQKVKVLDAYVLKADGTQSKIPAASMSDRRTDQAEAAPSFSSLRELEVKFEGMKVGDAAYLKLESITTRPTFDGRFDTLDVFPLLYDWKQIEINISAPANYPVFIDAVGLEGGKLPERNGRAIWQYRRRDIPRIEIEPSMLDVSGISPRFALTTFRNPEELGAAFWENVKQKAVVTPEVQTLADEITKNAATESEKASAIYAWVNKNIRYLSIYLDRGGWIPHSSTEILKNGYGDCKDYTTIIHALLKAKGIASIPVLIRSDLGDWFPSVATADFFNHAILYIPSLNVFADATAPNTRLGLINQTLVGKRAILAGEKTGLVRVPKDNPSENQILSEMTLDFAENGSVKALTKNTFVGRSEIIFRPLFSSSSMKRDSGMFVKVMLAYFGIKGEGSITDVGDPHNVGEPFAVTLESRIENLTTFLPKGSLEVPPGLNMLSMASMEQLTTTESRKTSVIVGATIIRETVIFKLPPTVKIVSVPEAVAFSNAVGSLRVLPEMKDGALRYTREMIIAKDVVEPSEYPLLKELIQKLMTSTDLRVEYSADPSLLRAKSKELRSQPANKKQIAPSTSIEDLLEFKPPQKLSPADVLRMEKKLAAEPNDVKTRVALIRHYSIFAMKQNAKTEAGHVAHRIWLINHNPEMNDEAIYGFASPEPSAASIGLLRNAWLTKVAENKDSPAIRMSAVSSMKLYAPKAAAMLAEEGAKVDPDNYRLLLLITEINAAEMAKEVTPEQAVRAANKTLEYGGRALALLKKERSDERDAERAQLLIKLSAAAIKAGDLDAATSFAQELVLDFGQTSHARIYDQAAHIGNTTLGLVELKRNNIPKADEHLLAAIRAPLRKGYNNISKIETSLARELYEKGEKAAVREYLSLCLTIPNFKIYPESYADELYALKLWIEQIDKGIKPNFDFGAPDSRLPLPKGVVRPSVKTVRSHE